MWQYSAAAPRGNLQTDETRCLAIMHSHEWHEPRVGTFRESSVAVRAIATLRVDSSQQVRALEKQNRHSQPRAIDAARAHTATWRRALADGSCDRDAARERCVSMPGIAEPGDLLPRR